MALITIRLAWPVELMRITAGNIPRYRVEPIGRVPFNEVEALGLPAQP
jgi:hypothetical protein